MMKSGLTPVSVMTRVMILGDVDRRAGGRADRRVGAGLIGDVTGGAEVGAAVGVAVGAAVGATVGSGVGKGELPYV